MRKMKKLVSLVLALVLAFALAAPAFATSEDPGTITIKNPTDTPDTSKHNYEVYRVFDMSRGTEVVEGTENKTAVSYTASKTLKEAIEKADEVKNYFTFTPGSTADTFVVTAAGDMAAKADDSVSEDAAKATRTAAAANFSQWLKTNLDSLGLTKVNKSTIELTGPGDQTPGWTELNVPYGYYFVDSTVGALCMLDSTNPKVEITDKNEDPTITKTSNEPSDLKIDDKLDYTIQIKVVPGSTDYTLVDTLKTGLALYTDTNNKTFTIKVGEMVDDKLTVGESEVPATAGDKTNYTINTTNPTTEGATFEIEFKADYLKTIEGKYIVVTYQATITDEATWAKDKDEKVLEYILLENEAYVKYGDNGDKQTQPSKTEDKLFKFDLVKTDGEKKLLDGAEFVLYAASSVEVDATSNKATLKEDATAISLAYNQATKTYRVVDSNGATSIPDGYTVDNVDSTKITVNGVVTIEGLKGTYYLKETKAPAGYNLLTDLKEINVTANNSATYDLDAKTYEKDGVQVINQAGGLLPSTGGIGTTIFYVVGGILVVGAAILLVTRKRVSGEK